MRAIYENENMIDKILRKVIALIIVLSLAFPFMAPGVFAASSVSINCGDNIKGGETFIVSVTFSGSNIGRVDAQLLYDTDELTYISGGTSSGNTGYVQLKNAGTGGNIVFNVKFQAIEDGDAYVQVTTNEMYDLDENMMDNPSASKTIMISGNASDDQKITEPTDEDPVEPSTLFGVDEMEEEEPPISMMTMLIISGAVFLVLLIIVIVVLVKKRKGNKIDEKFDRQYYEDEPRIGRSGKPLDPYGNKKHRQDGYWMDELMGSGNMDRSRDRRDTYRKRADEDTTVWDNWNIDQDDDYKDIDKW